MKLIILIFFTIMTVHTQAQMRVMTYNIKYDDRKDTINSWENRRDVIAGLIDFHQVDIFGTQEGLHHQIEYLQEKLPEFKVVGIGREGGEKGEYSALFYHAGKYDVLEQNTFWLSKTPEQVSVGWDAALPRICSWAKLKEKDSGKEFFVFNTHFDHRGEQARENSAKLLVTQIKLIAGDNPVVLTGDFNFTPDRNPYEILTGNKFEDSYVACPLEPYGITGTFNGFNFCEMPTRRIDYIFIKNDISVSSYGVLSDNYGLKYPSDHFPVLTELELK